MLEILSTLCTAPTKNEMRSNLLGISTTHYISMSFPFNLIKTAERNLEYYTLKNSYFGFKETEIAINAVKHNPGFISYLNDHGVENKNFEQIKTDMKILSKQICTLSNLKHGSNVDYTDFYSWQNKTIGNNGAKQKLSVIKIHKKLFQLWQSYYNEYNKINYILSQPNKNTGELKRSLEKYDISIIEQKDCFFVLLFPNENTSAVLYKNYNGRFIKRKNENWEKLITTNCIGLTEPTHVIKIEYTGDQPVFANSEN